MKENYIDTHHYADNDYENPKELFKFIGNIIEKKVTKNNSLSYLDVGCAKGEFLYYLKKRFSISESNLCGIDYSQTLIQLAKSFSGLNGVEFILAKAEEFSLNRKFDIIIATGLISWFDDYSQFLINQLNHLKDDGMLIITNGFSMSDYDVINRYRKYNEKDALKAGWNAHSIKGIKEFVEQRGMTLTSHKFKLPFSLERQEDILRSWTIETNEGQRFTNGLNFIWDLWSLEIK